MHPDLRHATPASSCWTMSPCCERWFARRHAPKDLNPDRLGWNQLCCQLHQGHTFVVQRKPWDSNSQIAIATTCFQNRLRAPTEGWSQPDDFRPLSCGSWNRTNGLLVQSQVSHTSSDDPAVLFVCSASLPPSAFILANRSAASVALPTATVPQCLHSSMSSFISVQRHARSCMVR